MDATGGSVLQEFFVETGVLPEVLAEIEEDAVFTIVKIDLVTTDAVRTIVDRYPQRHTAVFLNFFNSD